MFVSENLNNDLLKLHDLSQRQPPSKKQKLESGQSSNQKIDTQFIESVFENLTKRLRSGETFARRDVETFFSQTDASFKNHPRFEALQTELKLAEINKESFRDDPALYELLQNLMIEPEEAYKRLPSGFVSSIRFLEGFKRGERKPLPKTPEGVRMLGRAAKTIQDYAKFTDKPLSKNAEILMQAVGNYLVEALTPGVWQKTPWAHLLTEEAKTVLEIFDEQTKVLKEHNSNWNLPNYLYQLRARQEWRDFYCNYHWLTREFTSECSEPVLNAEALKKMVISPAVSRYQPGKSLDQEVLAPLKRMLELGFSGVLEKNFPSLEINLSFPKRPDDVSDFEEITSAKLNRFALLGNLYRQAPHISLRIFEGRELPHDRAVPQSGQALKLPRKQSCDLEYVVMRKCELSLNQDIREWLENNVKRFTISMGTDSTNREDAWKLCLGSLPASQTVEQVTFVDANPYVFTTSLPAVPWNNVRSALVFFNTYAKRPQGAVGFVESLSPQLASFFPNAEELRISCGNSIDHPHAKIPREALAIHNMQYLQEFEICYYSHEGASKENLFPIIEWEHLAPGPALKTLVLSCLPKATDDIVKELDTARLRKEDVGALVEWLKQYPHIKVEIRQADQENFSEIQEWLEESGLKVETDKDQGNIILRP